MSLVWLEGFDWIDQSASNANMITLLEHRYNTVTINSSGSIDTGRHIGNSLSFGTAVDFILTRNINNEITDTSHTCILGIAMRMPSAFSTGRPILQLQRGGGVCSRLLFQNDGTLFVYGTGFLGQTTQAFRQNAWYFIEYKVFCHNSTGTVDVKVNGESWASFSGIDTRPNNSLDGWDAVRVSNISNFVAGQLLDDWYICNGMGSVNNDYLGDIVVDHIVPNGDNSVVWTRSGGTTNYENIDNTPVSVDWEDTTYVQSGTSTNKDLYDYTNLDASLSSSTIYGVQIESIVRATDAATIGFKHKVKSGATELSKTTNNFQWDTYQPLWDFQELDPNISSAWTYTTLNAAQFGQEVA